ncbi:MAG: cytochrome c-type biogenesis protein [Pseudohongiellaceae bacterium]
MKISTILVLLLGIGVAASMPTSVQAQVDTFQFETSEQEERFQRLSTELRCPQCQNTNLTGSTGGVAEDLRRELHRMILEGMTDEEIEQFMLERYGDFIFYRPRLRPETVLLWFGPFIFLLIGVAIGFVIWRRAKPPHQTLAPDPAQQAQPRDIPGKETDQ